MPMTESQALATLVDAADGRAGVEPVVALAVAVLSPWSGTRPVLVDRPDRTAPTTAEPLLRFLASVQTQLSPSPAPGGGETGLLAWLRWSDRAVAVREVGRGPGWLVDEPLLADGWIALPPRGRHTLAVVNQDLIAVDARLGFLHLLSQQAADGAGEAPRVREAVGVLAEWLVGIRCADWSQIAGDQCPAMAVPAGRLWAWSSTVHAVPVDSVVTLLTGPALVPADWTVPPPTAAELAAEQERVRIIADGERAAREWDLKYRGGVRAARVGVR